MAIEEGPDELLVESTAVAAPLDWADLLDWVSAGPRDDAACLEHLWRVRFSPDGDYALCPRCNVVRRFRRYDGKVHRHAWTCTACGQYVYPRSGTIFEKSSTPLGVWFQAIELIGNSGGLLSARQLQRDLHVTYKTAWRMSKLIKGELADVPGAHLPPQRATAAGRKAS
jgi:transposase-like protein